MIAAAEAIRALSLPVGSGILATVALAFWATR